MAELQDTDPFQGSLILEEEYPGCMEVFFQPSRDAFKIAHGEISEIPRRLLARFDATKSTISIFPIVTTPSLRLLRPKYQNIREIVFEGIDVDPPKDGVEVPECLYVLPEGFIRDPMWGLGLQKNFKPIFDSIGEIGGIEIVVLTRTGGTRQEGSIFFLRYHDYENLRLGMNRIQSRFQREGLTDRRIFAHNEILTKLDPVRFPVRARPYKPDTIFSILGNNQRHEVRLSKSDRGALVQQVSERAREIAEKEPERLFKLHREIEVVALDQLINRFDEMLKRSTSEDDWQQLFLLNPFILSMVFGYPVVLLSQQAHVGGMDITGRGGKIADFLVKNEKTHNVAIVELKKPGTELVLDGFYRGDVHKISSDLTGAVVQVLDQRLRFSTSIAMHKMHMRGVEMESYSVGCVVIAGRTPVEADKQKALELYRGAFKDVTVLTFDELRQRLVVLRDYLSPTQEFDMSNAAMDDDPF